MRPERDPQGRARSKRQPALGCRLLLARRPSARKLHFCISSRFLRRSPSMCRKVPIFALVLALGATLAAPAAQAIPPRFIGPGAPTALGTVGLTDEFTSVFALNSDHTWAGLPNNRGGQSFICYSLFPPINYSFGSWRFDPRVPA